MASKEEGNHIAIRCKAPDSFPHRTIQWSKEVNGVKQSVRPSSHLTISQEKDLHFAYLDASDSGVYICTVNNLFIMKNVERKVSLDVVPGKHISRIVYAYFKQMTFDVVGCTIDIRDSRDRGKTERPTRQ